MAAQASVFEVLPMIQYSLQRWVASFQVTESEAIKNPMLSPEGMRREKGEDKKTIASTLTLGITHYR